MICQLHGKVDWKKHILCNNCKRVYTNSEAIGIFYDKGNKCSCGKFLMPRVGRNLKDFIFKKVQAVPLCPKCYRIDKVHEQTAKEIDDGLVNDSNK